MLSLNGLREHKGFYINTSPDLEEEIIVLTGKNGSGKTRLIESIKTGCTEVLFDGAEISPENVIFIKQADLKPNTGGKYNNNDFESQISGTLGLYDKMKNDLKSGVNLKPKQVNRTGLGNGLNYDHLFDLCLSISDKLGKPASELTHDDIILNFKEPFYDVLEFKGVSAVFNQYIVRYHKNEYNEFLHKKKGGDVSFWSHESFVENFGEKPWVLLNEILVDIFDGKFLFKEPDENSRTYDYQAELIQVDKGGDISVGSLSSGEKTLLWLALALFNSQYYYSVYINEKKLILIDEPDAFLHPKMVAKMYQVLESFNKNYNSIIILSTHSPSTVALAPSERVYVVDNNTLYMVEKDEAISELLDGVTQISISPENRRQVFVESKYDSDVYQAIYSKIAHTSELIDPKISLSFVSSGDKFPRQLLIDKVKQVLSVSNDTLINEFVDLVNGVGDCVRVIGQVESLTNDGSETVRGIIDWDTKNSPTDNVSVLAPDYAYSIENIILDPICILLMLHVSNPDKYSMESICGSSVNYLEWLNDQDLLQSSVDRYILKIFGRENKKDTYLEYMSSQRLDFDLEYLMMQGHALEKLVKERYEGLLAFGRSRKDGELKLEIVKRAMLVLTDGKFIPSVFEKVISEVQN